MGLFDRILRRFRDEPARQDAPGLFTARSAGLPSAPDRAPTPATEDDLWARPGPEPELTAIEELAPPAAEPETPVDPVWDDDTWDAASPTDAVAAAGSTADRPLFADPERAPEPPADEPTPVPALFDRPEVVAEPEPDALVPDPGPPAPEQPVPEQLAPEPPAHAEGRTVRVHHARLDTRPGPIRMTPSEAVRLAQEGPRSLRRRPDDPAS